jgi:RHS repeat-associated protein
MRATTTTTPSGGSQVTQGYVWHGNDLLMDSANAYIYSGGTAPPAEQVNLATGAITYLVTDSLGSVRATVNSSGALTGTTSYDAWGKPVTTGGLTASTPFGYAGGYTDPTGLIYLINRYYDPATGQFLSVDPEVDQTLAPYAYTSGNPVSQTDPTGDSPCECGGGSPPETATGKCANAIPSCRYGQALRGTLGTIKAIIGGDAFAKIFIELADGGPTNLLKAALLFGSKIGGKGPWDMKPRLVNLSADNPPEMTKNGGEPHSYSRITANRQIYYDIFGNVLYGYIGRLAGFTSGQLAVGATCGGLGQGVCPIAVGDNTAGNKEERKIGYQWYTDDLRGDNRDFTHDILPVLPQLNHTCQVRTYPESDALYNTEHCKGYKNPW